MSRRKSSTRRSPPIRSSSSDSAARRRRPPHSITRISSRSTTPARRMTPTYIVMEYVPGPNLKEAIRERGPLPEAEALTIGAQVAAALEAAHSAGPHPPRHQAAQRPAPSRWRCEGDGFRHRARRRGVAIDGDPDGDGHRALSLAGAGAASTARRALRPLQPRHRALRGADRAGAVQWRLARRRGDDAGA